MQREPARMYCNIPLTSADMTKQTVCSEQFIQLSQGEQGLASSNTFSAATVLGCVCADFLLLDALPADVLNTLR